RDRARALRLDGEYWSVAYEGDTFRLKDSKGIGYLHRLLASPGVEVHSLDLVMAHLGAPRAASRQGLETGTLGDAGALLDAEAKAAYRERLDDLREELDEAESWGDGER